ncbi:TonB-dependent receptor @ Iron siderophore receptor protein [uncultured Candidatus Thioglobus sp.]|nr:TonB-dependent receptor @ Iron siderophore receptor protein [uncultured Candidatus Thioglobus sp.]
MRTIIKLSLSFSFLFALFIPNVQAQSVTSAAELETIYVVGTRRAVRTVTDTALPIDVISGEDFSNQGSSDISDSLRTLVPSYNVSTQPISDAAMLVRPANLRGLAPDQSLIFLNGKRRHRSAVISFLGNGVSEGAQGPDISVIPAIALKRVEVLRDSASAQYGSDAIAGVINFVLKDSAEGGVFSTQIGQTNEGDGRAYRVSGNVGLPLGKRGFVNISAEARDANPTVRSVQRADAQAQIDAGNTDIEQPYAHIWGNPDVTDDFKTFVNLGLDLDKGKKLYAFGNYAQRQTEGGFFFRNPDGALSARNGVFRNGDNRLFFDGTPDGTNNCPIEDITTTGNSKYDTNTAPTTSGGELCRTFNEIFPGGFRPKFKGNLSDSALSAGIKGKVGENDYDISYTQGKNQVDFSIRDSINASYGLDTQTSFELGSYIQTEKTLNLDLNNSHNIAAFASPLYVATGMEWRNEKFEIKAGEEASWADGGYGQEGASIGANGFQGFSPRVAGSWDRSNIAAYIDLEADVKKGFNLKAMGRFEKHQDFSANTDFKLASLYRLNDNLSVRGSVGTGFRVPTVGQQNVQNLGTEFQGTQLVDRGRVPATCAEAIAVGAKPLTVEKSNSANIGLVGKLGKASFTLDYFNIKVNDRIGLSKNNTTTFVVNPCIENLQDGTVFTYLGNGFDTRTEGIDLVASMDVDLSKLLDGKSEFVFAGNWTKTKVADYDSNFIDDKRILLIEEALPKYRFNATLKHKNKNWKGFVRANYFGSYTELHLNTVSRKIHPGSEITVDIEGSYAPQKNVEWTLGVENIFNNFPDENPFVGDSGSKYPESSPMGNNGAFYYVRASYSF